MTVVVPRMTRRQGLLVSLSRLRGRGFWVAGYAAFLVGGSVGLILGAITVAAVGGADDNDNVASLFGLLGGIAGLLGLRRLRRAGKRLDVGPTIAERIAAVPRPAQSPSMHEPRAELVLARRWRVFPLIGVPVFVIGGGALFAFGASRGFHANAANGALVGALAMVMGAVGGFLLLRSAWSMRLSGDTLVVRGPRLRLDLPTSDITAFRFDGPRPWRMYMTVQTVRRGFIRFGPLSEQMLGGLPVLRAAAPGAVWEVIEPGSREALDPPIMQM